jgi:hypothetical protein
MNDATIDRAFELICDQPGIITRAGLMKAMKISSTTAGRYLAEMRDQKRIVRAGYSYYPAGNFDHFDHFDQHGDLKDLAIRPLRPVPGSKGLTSTSTTSTTSTNSNYKHIQTALP